MIVQKPPSPWLLPSKKALGADVAIHGENWNAVDKLARQRVEEDSASVCVSPYDNPLLWTGHYYQNYHELVLSF